MNLLLQPLGYEITERLENRAESIVGEMKPGMKVTRFPAGLRRQVHVSRPAIIANLRDKKNFPTVIVHDDGKMHEFHAALVSGLLKFEADGTLEAKVFISTEDEIVCYTDPGAEQTLLGLPPAAPETPKVTFWMRVKNAWNAFWTAAGVVADYTPILACMRHSNT
jgi:hypothetical protein